MKIINIIVVLSALTLASCEEWLDLKPDTQATEEQVFSTSAGYHSVLNGLYKSMGSSNLYGVDLAFGMVDCMSQQYSLKIANNVTSRQLYIDAGDFNYTSSYLTPTIEAVWLAAFNVIANANNLIQNVENASEDLFKEGKMEKDMILGEAYACRALMHFDMLRLFAPAPVHDDNQIYVPYVDRYPNIQASGITVTPFLEKVITDLEKGRDLVKEWDTSEIGVGLQITGKARFNNQFSFGTVIYDDYSNGSKIDAFFKGRGYRLNYYAITALLARVYQYAGKHLEAFNCAKEIMDFQVKDYYGLQSAFGKDDYNGIRRGDWDSKTDLKVISNLIFAVYNEKAYNDLGLEYFFKREFYSGSYPTWLVINQDVQKIFYTRGGVDESKTDYRALNMIFYATNSNGQYPISGKWFISENEETRDENLCVLPVIRATEMRYIMAEYHARNGDFGEAQNILNDIREKRGCTEKITVGSWNDFVDELIRDARREWISEGQLFYLYKRLDANIDFGKNVVRPMSRSEYLVPIPSNQSL